MTLYGIVATICFLLTFITVFIVLYREIGKQKPSYIVDWKLWWFGILLILTFSIVSFIIGLSI